ncbi:hypothetical protein ACXYMU_15965 [Pontibacter sp. CAU 1760]
MKRFIVIVSCCVMSVLLYFVTYRMLGHNFLVANAFIAFVTYGSFLFLLIIPSDSAGSKQDYTKYARIIIFVVIAESIVGILQYAAAATRSMAQGDAVQGTIGPVAFLSNSAGFGNQMFAINMVFMLLFLLPYVIAHKKGRLAFLMGIVALFLSSVVHVFFALLAGILLGGIFFRRHLLFSQWKAIVLSVGGVTLMVTVLAFYQPNVFRNISMHYRVYSQGNSPKNMVVDASLNKLPLDYPLVYITGLGPGQYTSRASLISSGTYGINSSLLPNTTSTFFQKHIYPIWRAYAANDAKYGSSTMSRPFFSLLSVYIEFGTVLSVLLLAYVVYLVVRLRREYIRSLDARDSTLQYLALASGMAVIFLVFVSAFENYLETTQAIFPGLMLIKIFFPSRKVPVLGEAA